MSAFEDAVEAAYKASRQRSQLGPRVAMSHALTAALPVLLDGLDREVLATAIQEAFPSAGGGYEIVWEDLLPAADAVIAHLRDEFGVTGR